MASRIISPMVRETLKQQQDEVRQRVSSNGGG